MQTQPNRKFDTPTWISVVAAVAMAALAGWLLAENLLVGFVLVVAVLAGIMILFSPTFGLAVLIATLVLGQIVRLSVAGSEGAVLPTDIVLFGFLAGWLLRGLIGRRLEIPGSPLAWPTGAMAAVMVITFILGVGQIPFLTGNEASKSALYLVRWLGYVAALFVIAATIRNQRQAQRTIGLLVASAAIVAILGFIQLRLFPDFRFMVPQGWDPHIGRLLSTWFDPNFLAGFLAFILCIVAAIASYRPSLKRLGPWVLVSVLFAAIILTYSRSGYAALLAGAIVLTWLRSKRMFFVLCVVAVAVVAFVPRVQERVQGAFNLDETSQLRLVSWQNALTVVRDFPLTGIGYNTYRYVQVTYGFQEDASEHSAGGSDSSLLTVLVTTGPLGLAAYLWMLWASATVAWSAFRTGATDFTRGLGLGALAGLASVTAHSFFINSLLLPHMMLTLSVTFGTLIGLRNIKGHLETE